MRGNMLQKARCHCTADRPVIRLLAAQLMVHLDNDAACQIARLLHRKLTGNYESRRAANLALTTSGTGNDLRDEICRKTQCIGCDIGRNSTCFRTGGCAYVVKQCRHITIFRGKVAYRRLTAECTCCRSWCVLRHVSQRQTEIVGGRRLTGALDTH